jgi:hypothetical protein
MREPMTMYGSLFSPFRKITGGIDHLKKFKNP